MHAGVEEDSMRHSSLLTPIAETVAVTGAMIIVGCAYIFLVRPGYMLNSPCCFRVHLAALVAASQSSLQPARKRSLHVGWHS